MLTLTRIPKKKFLTYLRPISQLHTTRPILAISEAPLDPLTQGFKPTVLNTPFQFKGEATSWNQAISEAHHLVKENDRLIDPARLVGDDLKQIKSNISKLLGSRHPFLNTVARHYFSGEGKHVRPLLVLLIAQATSIADKTLPTGQVDFKSMDTPISYGLENITTHDVFDRKTHYTPSVSDQGCTILPTQRRLAEISEMIHTASLLHDDVIDASMTRRNLPSANASFGNKMAVLGGDFLLARASLALARLRNAECIELMATCIANLVEGEFMQLRNTKDEAGKVKTLSTFDHYMEKTYMKTGSLIALS
ncbi:putative hexaprenyl pyrophosphate synthase, mitochondrial, partial [Choanephora cucurbitarum]